MIVNPILYWKTSLKAEEMIVSVSGRFTHSERRHLRNLKLKFFSINFVFYICWIPNLINAVLLWTLWNDLPRNFLLFDWYLMVSFVFFTSCKICSKYNSQTLYKPFRQLLIRCKL